VLASALGFGVYGLVVCATWWNCVKLLVLLVVIRRMVPQVQLIPRPTRRGLKEVFAYGMFSSFNAVVTRCAQSADSLLLGAYLGTSQIAYLSVPQQLLDSGATIINTAGRVLFPKFSSMNNEEDLREMFLRSTSLLLCISLSVFVPAVVVMPELLRLWMGPEFAAQSLFVAQIIAGSYALQGGFAPYIAFLKGTGRVHWLSTVWLVFGSLSIVMSFLLIRWLGLLGAGIRTWPLVSVGFILIAIICKRILRVHRLGRWLALAIVLPVVEAILLFGGLWSIWQTYAVPGRLGLMAGWSCMTGLSLVVLLLTQAIIFPNMKLMHHILSLPARRWPRLVSAVAQRRPFGVDK
jgi:O-antigen/teichoic acid export membrane protein